MATKTAAPLHVPPDWLFNNINVEKAKKHGEHMKLGIFSGGQEYSSLGSRYWSKEKIRQQWNLPTDSGEDVEMEDAPFASNSDDSDDDESDNEQDLLEREKFLAEGSKNALDFSVPPMPVEVNSIVNSIAWIYQDAWKCGSTADLQDAAEKADEQIKKVSRKAEHPARHTVNYETIMATIELARVTVLSWYTARSEGNTTDQKVLSHGLVQTLLFLVGTLHRTGILWSHASTDEVTQLLMPIINEGQPQLEKELAEAFMKEINRSSIEAAPYQIDTVKSAQEPIKKFFDSANAGNGEGLRDALDDIKKHNKALAKANQKAGVLKESGEIPLEELQTIAKMTEDRIADPVSMDRHKVAMAAKLRDLGYTPLLVSVEFDKKALESWIISNDHQQWMRVRIDTGRIDVKQLEKNISFRSHRKQLKLLEAAPPPVFNQPSPANPQGPPKKTTEEKENESDADPITENSPPPEPDLKRPKKTSQKEKADGPEGKSKSKGRTPVKPTAGVWRPPAFEEGVTPYGRLVGVKRLGSQARPSYRVIVNSGTEDHPLYNVYPGSVFGDMSISEIMLKRSEIKKSQWINQRKGKAVEQCEAVVQVQQRYSTEREPITYILVKFYEAGNTDSEGTVRNPLADTAPIREWLTWSELLRLLRKAAAETAVQSLLDIHEQNKEYLDECKQDSIHPDTSAPLQAKDRQDSPWLFPHRKSKKKVSVHEARLAAKEKKVKKAEELQEKARSLERRAKQVGLNSDHEKGEEQEEQEEQEEHEEED